MGRDDGMFTNYAEGDMAAAREGRIPDGLSLGNAMDRMRELVGAEARIPTPSDMQRDVVRGILQRGMELLDAKGHDYAGDDSTFINFTLTGLVLDHAVSRGLQQEDLAFVSFIATKLARLIELRGSGKTPKNETIQDTCMDLANYAALWGGWILTKKKKPIMWVDEVKEIPESTWMRFKEWADKEAEATPGKTHLLYGDEKVEYVSKEQSDLDLEATGYLEKDEEPWWGGSMLGPK